jgi:hypothetical protein
MMAEEDLYTDELTHHECVQDLFRVACEVVNMCACMKL